VRGGRRRRKKEGEVAVKSPRVWGVYKVSAKWISCIRMSGPRISTNYSCLLALARAARGLPAESQSSKMALSLLAAEE